MTLPGNTERFTLDAPAKREKIARRRKYARSIKKEARNLVRSERRQARIDAKRACFDTDREVVTGEHRFTMSRAFGTIPIPSL